MLGKQQICKECFVAHRKKAQKIYRDQYRKDQPERFCKGEECNIKIEAISCKKYCYECAIIVNKNNVQQSHLRRITERREDKGKIIMGKPKDDSEKWEYWDETYN